MRPAQDWAGNISGTWKRSPRHLWREFRRLPPGGDGVTEKSPKMNKRKREDSGDDQMNKKSPKCIQLLLQNESFCDVEFKVGGELIKAHKLILAVRSPVFEAMFYGSLPETSNPVVIPDVEPEGFKALLRYCYDCLELTEETVLPALYAAKKYMLTPLEDACRELCSENICAENIWEFYTWSLQYADDKLRDVCRDFFTKTVSSVASAFSSPAFIEIPHETLADFLSVNAIKPKNSEKETPGTILMAEIMLFQACNIWAKAECLRRKLDTSGSNKRTVLGTCLSSFHFPSMLTKDIIGIVFPTNILTTKEKLRIFEKRYSSSKSSVRHANFLLRMTSTVEPTWFEAESQIMSRSKLKYCSIDLAPKARIMLSGIWVKEYGFQLEDLPHTFIETVIFTTGNEIVFGKVVRPQRGFNKGYSPWVLYLPLEEILLDSDVIYTIQVETCKQPKYSYNLHQNHLSYEVKSPEDVNLDIVKDSSNGNIIGLDIRLV